MSFDFLSAASLLDVTKVSHHVIQLIRQWVYATSAADKLAVREDPTITDRQVDLIRRVVDSITEAEGAELSDIRRERVDWYVSELSRLLQDATGREMHTSAEKGRQLLDELRASLPRSGEGAA